MTVQTITFGSAQYNSWTAEAAGTDIVSTWTLADNITSAEAPVTGAIGAYSTGSQPVNLYSLRLYWWADSSPTTSTLDFEFGTSANGSGGWQSGATNANGANTTITANHLANRGSTRYYGFYKNDSGNIRFNTFTSAGNTIYNDGVESTNWGGRRQYAQVVVHSLPSAPGTPTGVTVNTTAVTLSWTAPTDTGSGAINGYRILKRLSTATANANTDWSIAVADTGSTATSRTITGLLPGTSYRFIVTAHNTVSDLLLTQDALTYSSIVAHTGTRSALSAAVNTLGGVYNGTNWVASPNIMTYNGTTWVAANIMTYSGTAWTQFGN
jgi:hypothetical protein